MFEKVLVANRGEIAVRVINACQEMGIKTVAVYSTADEKAPHVHLADEAVCIGEPAPSQSYLDMKKILGVAKETGAQAVHPGYGFLSENSAFALKCEKEGIAFIGPSAKVIDLMGDKIEAKKTMEKAGVPVIPGYHGKEQSMKRFSAEANKIGYPVIIKAAAGGGGKGMRIIREPGEMEQALESSKRESKSSFGDDTMFMEKYLEEPRHIEFQVLADKKGHTIHLFERECSIQRRHQKIIEETPSVALSPSLRKKMGEAAVKAAEAVGYVNAGTVEFMLSGKNFYFMEMNTRLQVEHPITEAVTGIDLVKWQLRIASGEALTLKQQDVIQRGHSIECRIYAEDPEKGFLPSTGLLQKLQLPRGVNVRHDVGIEVGQEVSPFYDPMLAKLTVHAETRDDAIGKMIWALSNYVTLGVTTNIAFLKEIMGHKEFRKGKTTTHFINEHFPEWVHANEVPPEVLFAVSIYDFLHYVPTKKSTGRGERDPFSPWKNVGKWRQGGEQ
ncbi:MAG: acetyl-CoA carboxylase biotin carboxylase subunit [Candidatus Thermoplasmatota archaeon]|nr:acetyl-CoA carboxylase biotin carboxylase subunit [Candidatus Thermoplasmatota archaeon]